MGRLKRTLQLFFAFLFTANLCAPAIALAAAKRPLSRKTQAALEKVFNELTEQYVKAETLEQKLLVLSVINYFANEVLMSAVPLTEAASAKPEAPPPAVILTLSKEELNKFSGPQPMSADQADRLTNLFKTLGEIQQSAGQPSPAIQENLEEIQNDVTAEQAEALIEALEKYIKQVEEGLIAKDQLPIDLALVQPIGGKTYDDVTEQIKSALAQPPPPAPAAVRVTNARKGFLHNVLMSMSNVAHRWQVKRELREKQARLDRAEREKQNALKAKERAECRERDAYIEKQMKMQNAYTLYVNKERERGNYGYSSYDYFRFRYENARGGPTPLGTVFKMVGLSLAIIPFATLLGSGVGIALDLFTLVALDEVAFNNGYQDALNTGVEIGFLTTTVVGFGVGVYLSYQVCEGLLAGYREH